MRLQQLFEKKEKGTYAGAHFDDDTKERIKTFMEENEIPNPVPANKLHTTILYSRKHCPDYKPAGEIDFNGKPIEFVIWEGQDGNNCLVLRYECEELVKRHEELMDEHDATYDFDEYNPHITLSYNAGDLDPKTLDASKVGDIHLVEEYGEDLDLEWQANNT